MFKFWIIKETMPLLITLAIIAALVIGCLVWVFIESIRDKFRKKPNAALSGGKAVRSNTLLGSGLNGSKRGVNWCIGCGHHNAPDAATCDLCGRGQK